MGWHRRLQTASEQAAAATAAEAATAAAAAATATALLTALVQSSTKIEPRTVVEVGHGEGEVTDVVTVRW